MTEPTDEQVEAVAKAIFRQAAKFYGWKTHWEKLLDDTRAQYRAEARAAIEAMPAPEVSVAAQDLIDTAQWARPHRTSAGGRDMKPTTPATAFPAARPHAHLSRHEPARLVCWAGDGWLAARPGHYG